MFPLNRGNGIEKMKKAKAIVMRDGKNEERRKTWELELLNIPYLGSA